MAGGFWTDKDPWPQRYEVRLMIGDDRHESQYLVTTWLGRDKAVALAVAMHVRRHGGHVGVHDVTVDELGPAGPGPGGRAEPNPGDLVDHVEFR
jgi:hypothetical protein